MTSIVVAVWKQVGKIMLWMVNWILVFFVFSRICFALQDQNFDLILLHIFLNSYVSAGDIPKKAFSISPVAPSTRKMHSSIPNCTTMPWWKRNSFVYFPNYFVFAVILSLASKICNLLSTKGWKDNWVLWSILWGIGRIRRSFWKPHYLRYVSKFRLSGRDL